MGRRGSGALYTTLGVPRTANKSEIKKAYHKLALELHPDKAGPENLDKFKAVQEAHSILIDDEKRKLYDALGREGMKRYADAPGAAAVAINPSLVLIYPIVLLLISSCLIAFFAMLAKHIDEGSNGSWAGTVFAPLWVACSLLGLVAVGSLLMIPKIVSDPEMDFAARMNSVFNVLSTVAVTALIIASLACVAQALDGSMTWNAAFVPVFMLLGLAVIASLWNCKYNNFVRRYSQEQQVDPESIDRGTIMGPWIGFILFTLFNEICQIVFIALLYGNIREGSSHDMSYWAVFSPLFVRIGAPLLGGLLRVCCNSSLQCCDKITLTFLTLLASSLSVVSVVLLALKCENARQGHPFSYPSAAQVLIPTFIVLGFSLVGGLFLLCGACNYLREQSDDGEVASSEPTDSTGYAKL